VRRAWAVFKREYLQEVRKKSFLILTVLMPFLFLGLMLIPALVLSKSVGGKRIAVVDGTGRLKAAFEENAWDGEAPRPEPGPAAGTPGRRASSALQISTEYRDATGRVEEESQAQRVRLREKGPGRLDGVLVIPAGAFEDPKARVVLYGRGGADFVTQERLARLVNRSVTRQRLVERGISAEEAERLLTPLRVDGAQVSRSGEVKTGGEAGFLVAFLFGALLILPMLIYGQEILRGIVAEKTDRVVEILISSMTPLQLLVGKILGVAAVGLTQVSVWLAMAAAAGAFAAAAAASAGFAAFAALDPRIFPMFLVFFVLGYLTYAAIYAIGGAVSNSDKEAQQFVAPIMLFLLLPWFLAMPILQSPDGRLATVLSIAPFFSPMAMFLRIVSSEPPLWQVALSILVSAATIVALFWLTAKIFRTGILSYGKRPTIPELWRWLKAA
jgi:ABC-2 type transport system permease protein